jgi:hypothetical protein
MELTAQRSLIRKDRVDQKRAALVLSAEDLYAVDELLLKGG